MSRIKDTDYLSISTRVRAMERRLLTREKLERMIDARSPEEAAKVLSQWGCGELSAFTPTALEELLSAAQGRVYQDLGAALPDPALLDLFRLKYDYQNARALVRAGAAGSLPGRLLAGGGRYDPAALEEGFRQGDLGDCSPTFARAVAEAAALMAETGEGAQADRVLDRAYYEELHQAARGSGSPFLQGYAALLTDGANLRSAVRSARLEEGGELLRRSLLPGGTVPPERIAGARGEELAALFRGTPLAAAAALGAPLARPGGGPLTAFEKACDDAAAAYMARAKQIPFGEAPVAAYLYARESELTALRIVLSGRMAGLDGDLIRARLRQSCI